ncbi:hypothetical protein ABZ876_08430 [Streptomyces sp. NPDC046931]|uniref:hypothetical protein n=1 Tax=Streptomyces sp. NPDC046931 TaxID=3154806 RepID=UPI0033F803CE
MTHTIRTTMQPTVELEVDDTEYLDLKRQGLLAYDDAEEATQAESGQPATSGNEAAAPPREQGPAANPATPDQAQAPAPATPSKPAKSATSKEG